MLQKVRKQGIKIWDERTFWHEIIYKSLIPTFGENPKFNPYLLFIFLIFYHSSYNKQSDKISTRKIFVVKKISSTTKEVEDILPRTFFT